MLATLAAARPLAALTSLHQLRSFVALSSEVATGLNILKKGSDPPLKPDDQLPDWLWGLAEPGKTLNELRRTKEADITDSEAVRLVKLANRDSIRTRNEHRAK